MDVQVGDVIITKKPHPCGANRFDVLRVGMDSTLLYWLILPYVGAHTPKLTGNPGDGSW